MGRISTSLHFYIGIFFLPLLVDETFFEVVDFFVISVEGVVVVVPCRRLIIIVTNLLFHFDKIIPPP